jgi:hypothetical protein
MQLIVTTMAGLASKTYDPSEQAPFKIEVASSGRSKCRNPACCGDKKMIKKGELRIARMEKSPTEELNQRLHGKLMPKWVHMRCCAPVILREAVNQYGGIEGVPGYDALEPDTIGEDPKAEAKALTCSILGIADDSKKKKSGGTITSKTTTTTKTTASKKSRQPGANLDESSSGGKRERAQSQPGKESRRRLA